MELKEFVKETLVQIFEGVKESQIAVDEIGGMLSIVAGGAGSEDKNKAESMTKVRFPVPVCLP